LIDFLLTIAQNGEQALDFVRDTIPDLILMDILMPKMDGIETCLQLKKDDNSKNIPVLFITAISQTAEKVKAFNAGGVDYLTKPFAKEEVLARVKFHINYSFMLKKLKQVAITDDLTGVYNRRFFYEVINRQVEFSKRQSSNFVICYLDIDNLKKVNDSYSHKEGDKLILKIVNTMKQTIRKTDYIFRMGGDEFLILFPNSQISDAEKLMKRIRANVKRKSIKGIPVDFSFGLSEYQHNKNISIDDLICKADSRMYVAKKAKKREAAK